MMCFQGALPLRLVHTLQILTLYTGLHMENAHEKADGNRQILNYSQEMFLTYA